MQIKKIGVIGAGQMGNGIAHVCAVAGYEVGIHDVQPSRIEEGRTCKLKSDCTGPISFFPVGCSVYVNKESADLIRDLISRDPHRGEWKCKKIMGYDCISGKCTAKEIPGEKYPGVQCVADSDCNTIACDRFNGPIKSGYQSECVDVRNSSYPRECRCMCRGCK